MPTTVIKSIGIGSPVSLTGTVNAQSANQNTIVGTGTLWSSELTTSNRIIIDGISYGITTITDNTHIILDSYLSQAIAGGTACYKNGTARDYATINLWVASIPANLVTADQVYKGECYNDALFFEKVSISGITTDSTRFVWLTAAAGHRHDGKRYKTSGVRVSHSYSYAPLFQVHNAPYTIVEYIQFYPASGQSGLTANQSASELPIFRNNIIYYVTQQGGFYAPGISATGTGAKIYNNLVYGNALINGIELNYGVVAYNNTVYSRTGTSDYGMHGNNTARNNISVLNAGVCYSGFNVGTFSNNVSSDSTGNTGLTGKTASDIFVSVTSGSEDFELKAGSPAIGAGVDLSSVFTDDIVGQPRSAPWDCGAWKAALGSWFLLSMKNQLAYPNNF